MRPVRERRLAGLCSQMLPCRGPHATWGLIVGTDHELISCCTTDKAYPARTHGPRLPPRLDQDTLSDLARQFNSPCKQDRFKLSASAKQLGHAARRSKTSAAWKQYQAQVRREHVSWQQARAARACSDWETFRNHKRDRWPSSMTLTLTWQSPNTLTRASMM